MASNETLNFQFVSWDSIRNHLKDTVQSRRIQSNDHWLDLLDQRVSKCQRELNRTSNQVENYMKWIRSRNKNIKSTSKTIPSSILGGNSLEAELIDVRISCRGPDDKLYDRDEQYRQRLPRGCTLIECRVKNEAQVRLDFALFALRKFSGGLGDDDDREDDNQGWLRYFLQHPRTASQVICTRKVNGEACHLSCLALPNQNQLVLVAGSKNVHLCFRTHSDINAYGKDTTYAYAGPFCHVILDTLEAMPDRGSNLMNFLALTRYTAVFEILNYQHQHIVNLEYLKDKPNRSELKFITFSHVPDDFDATVTSLCALPPDNAIEIGRALNLPTTDYEIIENRSEALNEHLISIKYRHECEGSVLYFLNANDEVIGLLKKKSIWYVILRAIREKARPMLSNWEKKHQMELNDTIQRISKRLNAIQKWLGFSDVILDRWKTLATEYLTWLSEGAKKRTILRDDISNNYPILWRKFIEEKNFRDDFMISMIPNAKDVEDVWKRLNDFKIENKQVEKRPSDRKTKQRSDVNVEPEENISEPEDEEEEEEETNVVI